MLKWKIVLVTWWTWLLWKAIALKFLKKWSIVLLNYYNDDNKAIEFKNEMISKGYKIFLYKYDITNYKQIDFMFIDILNNFKTIDILINNAWWLWSYWDFHKLDILDIEETFRLNLFSSMHTSKNYLKIINSQHKKWLIINTTSSYSNYDKWGDNKAIPYCSSKAWLDSFTIMLAKNISPNIRVNSISPWPIFYWSEFNDKRFNWKLLNQNWVTPEQVAEWFIFVANNEWINWQIINIDWGLFYWI